jgi:GAF domain-containing protein
MAEEARLLTALRRYAQTMAADYDLTDVLHQLTHEVTNVLAITGAGIVLAGQDGRLAYATASTETIADLERVQEETQSGPCSEAFREQVVVAVPDLDDHSEWDRYRQEAQRIGIRSVAGLPLGLGSERLGALNLYDDEPHEWTEEELSAARVLADMAAGYMIHEQLQDTRRLAEQLQTALDSRVVIEQAKGLVAADLQISIDDAFEVLRSTARSRNQTLRELAAAVVNDGYRPTRP